jgi:hypothetical protein
MCKRSALAPHLACGGRRARGIEACASVLGGRRGSHAHAGGESMGTYVGRAIWREVRAAQFGAGAYAGPRVSAIWRMALSHNKWLFTPRV